MSTLLAPTSMLAVRVQLNEEVAIQDCLHVLVYAVRRQRPEAVVYANEIAPAEWCVFALEDDGD